MCEWSFTLATWRCFLYYAAAAPGPLSGGQLSTAQPRVPQLVVIEMWPETSLERIGLTQTLSWPHRQLKSAARGVPVGVWVVEVPPLLGGGLGGVLKGLSWVISVGWSMCAE